MDEEDFEYIPLTKKKKKNSVTADKKKKEENTKKLSRNKKGDNNKAQNKVDSTPSKSQGQHGQTRHKRKTPKSKTPKKERKKYDGYCPVCQMPFSALVMIETPSWHAAECIDNYKPESDKQKKGKTRLNFDGSKTCSETEFELSENAKSSSSVSSQIVTHNTSSNSHVVIDIFSSCKSGSSQEDTEYSVAVINNTTNSSPEVMNTCRPSKSQSSPDYTEYNVVVTNDTSNNSQEVMNTSICRPSKPQSSQDYTEYNVVVTNDTPSNSQEVMNISSPSKSESSQDVTNNTSNYSQGVMNKCSGSDSKLSKDVLDDDDEVKSPRDLTSYLEEAFKEATYCSQKSEVITSDEPLESLEQREHDMQTSQYGKSGVGVDCADIDSCLSQPLFEDDEIVQSGKSVSDIDASQDSNSQSKSFFANYRRRMESVENTNSNDSENSQKFSQQSCKKDYQIVNSELTCLSSQKLEIEGNEFADKNPSDVEFSNIEMTNKLPTDPDLCISNEQRDKHLDDLVILDTDDTDSDVQYISTCDVKKSDSVPSSHGSINSATMNRTKGAKKSKAVNLTGSSKKSKLSKQQSDMKNQPSLLSFFSGSKTDKGSKDKTNANNNYILNSSNNFVSIKSKLNGAIPSQLSSTESCDSFVKEKNVNTVLMNSMKRSTTEPCKDLDATSKNYKPALVKNASDILMSSVSKHVKEKESLPRNRKMITKDDKELQNVLGVENSGKGNQSTKPVRYCPFYKKIPETGFTVDAFCYGNVPGCKAYFLSHFHYDHYRGLTKKFSAPIYCSKVTGNLIKSRIGINPDIVHDLPMNTPVTVEGTEVLLLEANHCPGSVLFLFKTHQGKLILHTGDFRADPSMEEMSCLQNVRIHQLYLDTTYCDPKYAFPPQKLVIEFGVSLVEKILTEKPKTLVVCGSYTIGKERIFTAIARRFDCKICVQRDKYKVLECLEDPDLTARLTLDGNETFLHVLPMKKLNLQGLHEHRSKLRTEYNNVVAIEPTGWTYNDKMVSLDQIKPKGNKEIQIYGLPYSEHSSYLELKRFVQYIRPDQILPTVNNGNPASRRMMESLFESWMTDDKAENKPKQTKIGAWAK
ncbi:DNA cross-link repair 1A protein-like isoform X2 [Mytilus trossulus]|uniref:DNA cross-link repair 1A protein-like isoform X2 n=1 Tax=Mytilus trossulus TaxID=6551 RepID=UPI00300787E2